MKTYKISIEEWDVEGRGYRETSEKSDHIPGLPERSNHEEATSSPIL